LARRILTILLFVAIVGLGYLYKDQLVDWIKGGGSMSVIVSIVFVAILVFFPVMPFIVVAGIIGAVFGTIYGSLISLTGALVGALVMFLMARYGFRDWAQRMLQKYPKVKEYESYFEKNAFLGILFVRVVPVVPSPAVNIISGISRVSVVTFFLASLLGKIPSIVIFTFAGSNFGDNKTASFVTYGVYFVAIMIATSIVMYKRQQKNA
jgi:uncharacterized membrane protein YdjX (TVP38/TMEM64 family)